MACAHLSYKDPSFRDYEIRFSGDNVYLLQVSIESQQMKGVGFRGNACLYRKLFIERCTRRVGNGSYLKRRNMINIVHDSPSELHSTYLGVYNVTAVADG